MVGMGTTVSASSLPDQEASLLRWLSGSEALIAARSDLSRRRLPRDLADDVVQEAARRVIETMGRRSAPFEEFRAEPYARRVLQRVVGDLLRSAHGALPPLDVTRPAEIESAPVERADPVDVADAVMSALIAQQAEERCRRALHTLLGSKAWAGAAALVLVTLACHPTVEVSPDAPRPVTGAGEAQAQAWSALFYAGRHDCLPGPRGDGVAVRKRRSRALAEVAALLRRAGDVAGLLEEDETA
jgi:hypothetical protein